MAFKILEEEQEFVDATMYTLDALTRLVSPMIVQGLTGNVE